MKLLEGKENIAKCIYVATGCFAQLKPKKITTIKGVDMVLGANEKFNIKLLTDLNKREETKYMDVKLTI